MKVSILKHARDKKIVLQEVTSVLKGIQDCIKQKEIDQLRAEKDKKKNRLLKENLPAILWAGEFSKRGDENLNKHSGKCVIDLDHIGDIEKVELEKEKLKSIPYIFAIFISPNGDGLKVIVNIPPCSINDHRRYYVALMKVFPQSDTTSINPERLCFVSCDRNIYVNWEATQFTDMATQEEVDKISPVKISPNGEVKHNNSKVLTNYTLCDRAVKIIRDAPEGMKHNACLKAGKLMGGFIGGGQVQEYEGLDILYKAITWKPNIDDLEAAKKAIRDGVQYGQGLPIAQVEKELNELTASSKDFTDLEKLKAQMKHNFVFGKARGTTTYFEQFDKNYTWKKQEVTLTVGIGGSGKTEFILQLMLMKSVFDGDKWGIFSPENHPAEDFYDALIHAYIGATTDPYYRDSQMTMDEYDRGFDFITKHFFYVYPEENQTIEDIESMFLHLIETENINGVLVDPHNEVDTPDFQREDLFLKTYLKHRRQFARKHDLYYHITAHPKGMFLDPKTKEYPIVNIYNISGGSMWSNKIHNIISVHRPFKLQDPKNPIVEIHVLRIKKQKLVGLPGMCTFDYSRIKNRFYLNEFNPLDNLKPNAKPDFAEHEKRFLREPIKHFETVADKEEIEKMPF